MADLSATDLAQLQARGIGEDEVPVDERDIAIDAAFLEHFLGAVRGNARHHVEERPANRLRHVSGQVSLARAVGAAVEATAATTTAGRVAAVLTKPLVTVNVSSRTAAVARFAILGTDLAFAGEGVHHAMKECDQLLNQLSSSEGAGTGGSRDRR